MSPSTAKQKRRNNAATVNPPRDVVLQVICTPEFKKQIRMMADADGVSMSALVKQLINREARDWKFKGTFPTA